MTTINGYKLLGELTAHNAGFSRWAFCRKGGHEYYIKEFLSPVYPVDGSDLSERLVARRRAICDDFYQQKRAFYSKLGQCRTGNNVIVHDFFRSGSKYYAVTERIYTSDLKIEDVHRLERGKRETLIKTLLYSVAALHEHGIVHADLKPDNLLIKQTKDHYHTVKVIDFDAGFLEGQVPQELQGDFVYLSPEAYLRMNEKDVDVTTKADVFALGLIVHQFWTGGLPWFDAQYKYAFQAALAGAGITVSDAMPDALRECLGRMLAKNPSERPRLREVLDRLGVRESETSPWNDPLHKGQKPEPHRKGFYVPEDL